MKPNPCVSLEVNGAVATVTLNAPETLNALNQTMRFGLIEATTEIEARDEIRVVILTGAGRAFSAGADLTEGMPDHDNFIDQCAAEYKPWVMAIHDSKKIYIAAVQGACAGASSAVAMNCDLMVMAEDAFIYQAFSAIGLMPDMGATWLLLQKIGYQRAFEMAIDAGRLSAKECLALGIANKVVAPESLMEEASSWAARLATGAPLAQRATKQLMRKAFSMTYDKVIDAEAVLQTKLLESEDAQNAAAAFLNKQKPSFNGR